MRKFRISRRQKRYLIAKTIRTLVNSILFLGMLTIYGSLGAVETDLISFQQFIVQLIIGVALIVFYAYAHYKIYEEDYER